MCDLALLRIIPAAALTITLCLASFAVHAAETVVLTETPSDINISASYRGTTLHVEGLAPQDSAIAVRFAGEKTDLALRQKGMVFDLLWMNLGTVHLHNVPSVFLVASSRPLADVGGADLGLEAVRKAITAEENKGDALDIPAELIKLKQQDGLYRESTRGITVADNGSFTANMPIPSRMSPGAYTLEVFALRNGSIAGSASAPVTVRLVGMPAWIDHMARDNSLLYGILSTLIAILGGLAIGIVFQSRGGAH